MVLDLVISHWSLVISYLVIRQMTNDKQLTSILNPINPIIGFFGKN